MVLNTIIRINNDGSMNDIKINISKNNILSKLKKNSNNIGDGTFCELYEWNIDGNKLKCYGWYEGDISFLNKHRLIPNGNSSFLEEDSSKIRLYGDIFIICFSNNKIKNMDVTEYAILYETKNNENYDTETDEEEIYSETESENVVSEEENEKIDNDNDNDNDNYNYNNEIYDNILDYDRNDYDLII